MVFGDQVELASLGASHAGAFPVAFQEASFLSAFQAASSREVVP